MMFVCLFVCLFVWLTGRLAASHNSLAAKGVNPEIRYAGNVLAE